jgi:hypothetical protein
MDGFDQADLDRFHGIVAGVYGHLSMYPGELVVMTMRDPVVLAN